MPATFDKLGTSSLRGRIAEKLRSAILEGSLLEGERLVERRLADAFGSSLTAVREALVELELEGFLVKLPNSATYVIRLSNSDVENIIAVRRALETLAVCDAARNASEDDVQHLRALLEAATQAAQAGEVRPYLQKELTLHEAIWTTSKNTYLESALRRLLRPYYAFTTIRMAEATADDLTVRAESHKAIIDAIEAHTPEAAQDALQSALPSWNPKGWSNEGLSA